jgi:hypothetical protein
VDEVKEVKELGEVRERGESGIGLPASGFGITKEEM